MVEKARGRRGDFEVDPRRLTTFDALVAGIMGKPLIDCPHSVDREILEADYEFEYIGTEAIREAIEEGKVVKSCNYFGIPRIWKEEGPGEKTRFSVIDLGIDAPTEFTEKRYRVFLTQYRSVTEDKTFKDRTEAIEFFEELCSKTMG